MYDLTNTNIWVTNVKYTYKKKLDILLYLDLIEVKKKNRGIVFGI